MKNSFKKIGLLTSGGDAPGMNAAIRAVVRTCVFHNITPIGISKGYDGLIRGEMQKMNARSVKGIINKGGTILKTARSKDFRNKKGREKAYKSLKDNSIDGLIVIGGDGTFTGGLIFSNEFNFPVIGIPATIDNDIFGTSHTIGFDSATNTVMTAIDKIRDTASSHNRLFFIEVMGRDAGHIALNVGVAGGAEEILIPEEDLGLDRLIQSLKRSQKTGKSSSIVVVAEGDNTGENVFQLKEYVEKHLSDYEARVSVLGHMQRGGPPTCFDRVLASRLGVNAVESMINGKNCSMVGLKDNAVVLTPFKKAIKGITKINSELLRVSDIMSI
ncbi:MAG: 6-phosphofructokinase [Flavobacteriales bacterium]|nr:6-phosphofructokinase [Flavobacteriales bacterium]